MDEIDYTVDRAIIVITLCQTRMDDFGVTKYGASEVLRDGIGKNIGLL